MATEEYKLEQDRVNWVVSQIKAKIQSVSAEYDKAHAEMKLVQQNYSANTSVNYIEVDDRIETSAELQQQRALASRLIENESIIKSQLETYETLQQSPYFGRIDISDPGEAETEQLYIGTASLTDNDENFLVYDWRAPISSIYYNGTLGEVSYETPAGQQTTELKKKRQFLIQNGHIESMFDTNETVGDEMLQHVLGQQNDETMQNIVATIQREQNDIIRDTRSDLLVVQGVAGSGKTSAILQRIAFLLYHSRKELEADQIVLFSPNKLFSHYISDVLPSLGERNMRQVTLAEFLSQRLQGLNVETLFDRYEQSVDLSAEQQAVRDFQESATYMAAINDYCQQLKPADFQFNAILFDGRVFFSREEIEAIYQKLPDVHPAERFLRTKNVLIKRLKRRIASEAKAKWVSDTIDQLSDEAYHDLLGGKQRHDFQQLDDEVAFIARKIVTRRLRTVYDAIYNNYFLDPYRQYSAFMAQLKLPASVSSSTFAERRQAFNDAIEFHNCPLVDAAPLLYLRDLLTGGGQNFAMKHLFVDEMQDYSIAQLQYLHQAFPKAHMTFLGDSQQALFRSVQRPEDLLNELKAAFNVHRPRLLKLNRSYRSTYPITTFAKALLPDGNDIEAFNRDGDVPKILISADEAAAIKSINRELTRATATQGTAAILTKDLDQAHDVYQKLRHLRQDVTLLTDTDRSLPKGVLVLPVYLAKGLEFDTVICWNVSETNFNDDRLLGTLYTMASRAMHDLVIVSIGAASPLITKRELPVGSLQIEHELSN
ncbi:AAA family ATPase [Secundilactobacillus kimchicus]|uniref:RNA polymerase recycling motor HelD n=1 Tax=Secundilactobacillus kimchicus TaxID=528209 RepID=UPI001C0214A7|nr:RNA polymerase recycling motor HelD [Secundilactobacillus kimchicus]MBT9670756.1 AAA family ATPase [Secundilactobacillus kimchicus]